MLTIQWQPLTPELGAGVPEQVELAGCGDQYRRALELSRGEYERLVDRGLGQSAPYALCLGYRIRFILDLNAREAMQLIELRSGREGHPSYRAVAHEMHAQIASVHPAVAEAMKHVDTDTEPRLERILSEMRSQAHGRVPGRRPRNPDSPRGLTLAGHVLPQPVVAERAARIESLHQRDEVGQALDTGDRWSRRREEQLAPVWPGAERDQGRPRPRSGPRRTAASSGPQVKCKPDHVLAVGRAHPELVGGDRADLGDLQQRPDRLAKPRSAPIAAIACPRGSRYSDWISSPALGVNPIRKCGSRSDQRPGMPS